MMSQIFSSYLQCKSLCNLVKDPILYSYPKNFFNNTKFLNFTNLFNHSDVFDYLFILFIYLFIYFLMLYNCSYNFIKISLLTFIFWNYIIYFYILIFP